MLPHPHGEELSLFSAMKEIGQAFSNFAVPDDLGVDGIGWVAEVKALMSTSGLSDPNGEGLYLVRARAMTIDERARFSLLVDELASLFLEHDRRGA